MGALRSAPPTFGKYACSRRPFFQYSTDSSFSIEKIRRGEEGRTKPGPPRQTHAVDLKIPKSTKNVTATVENALNTAHEATVTVTGLPTDFDAEYTVTSGNTDLSAYNFTVANEKLTWKDTPAFGAYTLTITDKGGVYAPFSTSFELKTADVIAKYDASKKAIVKASSDITDEQFAAYSGSKRFL